MTWTGIPAWQRVGSKLDVHAEANVLQLLKEVVDLDSRGKGRVAVVPNDLCTADLRVRG